jgi:multiple sugar transport system permease protein
MTLVVMGALLPFVWAALTAIKPFIDAFTYPPTWSFTPTLKPFSDLWSTTDFGAVYANTLIVAAAAVVVSIILGAPAAYALARYRGSLGAWLLITALVFRAIPRFAVVLPFYNIARTLGLYDTRQMLVVALVAVNQPFTLWLLRNFFVQLPRDLEEAAVVDGCTRFQAFYRVILPLAAPGLLTSAIFTFLVAYQEYAIPVALTQTHAVTLPVFVASFATTQDVSLYQLTAAASVSLALPIILIAFFGQKYLVSGLTGGAVKG